MLTIDTATEMANRKVYSRAKFTSQTHLARAVCFVTK
jgi:hypothetical protein